MKVSQKKKEETRRKLINTAADLFVADGFEETPMKKIAREAGVGDATIYKYFPNKDKLVLGFYNVRGMDALETYRTTPDLADYTLAEKLQLLVDTYIEQLMGDREFVEMSIKLFMKSPLSLLRDELSITQAYQQEFQALLSQASDDEDYPEIPMQSTVAVLLTDYLFGITLYWIKDDSEEFANTTQLTDLSVGLIDTVLKSGMINKALDIAGFVLKTHLLRSLSGGNNILSMVKEFRSAIDLQSR